MTFDSDFATEWADLLEATGRSITHRPGGVAANDVTITAAFATPPARTANYKDDTTGEARVSKATVYASTGLSIDQDSQFVIDSEVWSVTAPGPIQGGHQAFPVQRVDEDRRNTRSRGMR